MALIVGDLMGLGMPALLAQKLVDAAGGIITGARWMLNASTGALENDATNGTSLFFNRLNTGPYIKEGTGGRMGTAVLVAGTVVVTNANIAATDRIFLSRSTTGGTAGHLSYTISAGASFTINSSSGTDTSTINWFIIGAL